MSNDVDSVVADLLCLLQERVPVPLSVDGVDLDSVQALSDCIDATSETILLLQSLNLVLALREGKRGVAWAVLAHLEEQHKGAAMTPLLSRLLAESYEKSIPYGYESEACVEGNTVCSSIHQELRHSFGREHS